MKKTLVTGGLGFLGAALTKALVARGEDVRVFDNSSRGSVEKLGDVAKQVEIVEGDIRDPRAVRKAVAGTDRVAHLAFVNGTEFFYSFPAYVLDVGVKGMTNVLDACIQEDVNDLVVASSSEVYQTPPTVPTAEDAPLSVPDPLNPRYSYGGGKILYELMTINYGRAHFDRAVLFRPHNVYGPMMGWEHVVPQFIKRMQKLMAEDATRPLPFPIQGTGADIRSFNYIDDFTRGLLTVIDKGEHLNIYHIGAMDEISMADVARKIGAIMGTEIALMPGESPKGNTPRRCPDIAKLRALGYEPSVSLDEGLAKTVEWYLAHETPPPRTLVEPPPFFAS